MRQIVNVLYFLILTFMTWSSTWGMEPAWDDRTVPPAHPQEPVQAALRLADKSVNQAWDAFHRAALGGTLASPAIQTKIEQALHESRRLLVDAREAAHGHDQRTVFALITRIEELSKQIRENSQRQKP